MIDFIKENIEIITPIIIAVITAGAWFSYKKSKSTKTIQKNIKTKSGDVIGGNKTTLKNE